MLQHAFLIAWALYATFGTLIAINRYLAGIPLAHKYVVTGIIIVSLLWIGAMWWAVLTI